jgi:hypothetical protein
VWDVEATDAFGVWWLELAEHEQDDVTAAVELLAERGPRLPFPYCSGIRGSRFSHLRELRIQSRGAPVRVFYAFDPRRVAVLLTGGIKSGNEKRFYKDLVAKADKIYEQHLKGLED